jgi:hypothetical protein
MAANKDKILGKDDKKLGILQPYKRHFDTYSKIYGIIFIISFFFEVFIYYLRNKPMYTDSDIMINIPEDLAQRLGIIERVQEIKIDSKYRNLFSLQYLLFVNILRSNRLRDAYRNALVQYQPFLIIYGFFNSGKSAVQNFLIGYPIFKSADVAFQDDYRVWMLPLEREKKYNILDTQGLDNQIGYKLLFNTITTPLMPINKADLIMNMDRLLKQNGLMKLFTTSSNAVIICITPNVIDDLLGLEYPRNRHTYSMLQRYPIFIKFEKYMFRETIGNLHRISDRVIFLITRKDELTLGHNFIIPDRNIVQSYKDKLRELLGVEYPELIARPIFAISPVMGLIAKLTENNYNEHNIPDEVMKLYYSAYVHILNHPEIDITHRSSLEAKKVVIARIYSHREIIRQQYLGEEEQLFGETVNKLI